jgi:RimJ/RimL family protein N-acetyltransferase
MSSRLTPQQRPNAEGQRPLLVIQTQRLRLRHFSSDDAEFVLELLNEPSFLRFIGDKGVRSLDDARRYIANGPVDSYERNGFGLYLVELKEDGTAIGMCGLLKRDGLPDPDIGFAFLPRYWSRGYAVEAAAEVITYAREILRLTRILAITSLDNESSGRLLEKIGLKFERTVKLSEDGEELRLFVSDVS